MSLDMMIETIIYILVFHFNFYSMFNSYSKVRGLIPFSSNPSLEEKPVVVGDIVDGVITNHIDYQYQDNRSKLESVIYDPLKMSLRAKINLGVTFAEVANPQLDDFAKAYSKLENLEQQIQIKMKESASKKSIVEPSKSE